MSIIVILLLTIVAVALAAGPEWNWQPLRDFKIKIKSIWLNFKDKVW